MRSDVEEWWGVGRSGEEWWEPGGPQATAAAVAPSHHPPTRSTNTNKQLRLCVWRWQKIMFILNKYLSFLKIWDRVPVKSVTQGVRCRWVDTGSHGRKATAGRGLWLVGVRGCATIPQSPGAPSDVTCCWRTVSRWWSTMVEWCNMVQCGLLWLGKGGKPPNYTALWTVSWFWGPVATSQLSWHAIGNVNASWDEILIKTRPSKLSSTTYETCLSYV